MDSSEIIPLPPGHTGQDYQGKEVAVVGFYPCINNSGCNEYLLIKIGKGNRPYGTCTRGEITAGGCTRAVKGIGADLPSQTYEVFKAAFERHRDLLPDVTARYLEKAWINYNVSTQNG